MKYLYLILLISNLYSFEVNTHQAITKCAIENNDNKCNKQGADNLHKFARNMGLENIDYEDEIFEKYNNKYFKYAKKGTGFKPWKIDFTNNGNYKDLIEAGSILEDSIYYDNKYISFDGRFNNHFYSVQATTTPHLTSDTLTDIGYCAVGVTLGV